MFKDTIVCFLFASLMVPYSVLKLYAFDCTLYTATPPFLSETVTPSTTIILDNSGSMFEHAYQERHVNWYYDDTYSSGNRRCYAGFDTSHEYYGYFDSNSYYSYYDDGENGYFYEDQNGPWSGNFLNWVCMHRIDVARKVLTGGKYEKIDSINYLRIEITDGGGQRGKYHVYNDTDAVIDINGNSKYMTPFHTAIGVAQWAYYNFFEIYQVKSVDNLTQGAENGETWHISPATNNFGRFYLRVKVDNEPAGVLDNISGRMRLALFVYDNDGDYHNGGEVRKYMGASLAEIKDAINNELPATWTPLAETLYTVCGYIEQSNINNNGPRYENDSYNLDNNNHDYPDPFYFAERDELIYCTKQNVILITDGESTMDTNIPDNLKDYDGDNHDSTYTGSYGTDYLDDIALWAHTNDLRSDLQGVQTIDLYTVFAFGSGSQLLKDAAINGGFVDRNGNNRPDLQEEWDEDGDGVPDNYFEASSGKELEKALNKTFSKILERMASGSAASVISSARSGAGAIFQAVFWPRKYDAYGHEVTWVGDVHAF
jgi:type IV pilus assembly protein PilY1